MSTSRNREASGVNTIPSAPAEEVRGGELVPVGNYAALAPYTSAAWHGVPAPRPDMLSAGPDPMSMLRCFKRRWPLATGLGILVGLIAMAAAWFMIPETGEVVAYVHVARNAESLTRETQRTDFSDYQTLRATTIEMMRNKSLLTRALRDPAISQLPLIKKQNDPIDWLRDQLSMKFPNDAELLLITMSGEELDQIVKIVNAVVDAYFREVVEKQVAERNQKEEKLRKLYEEKSQQLVREMNEIETLQSALGVVDPQQAAVQNQLLQAQLGVVRNTTFQLQGQISQLDVQIDQYKLDVALAQDPAAKEAKMEEEVHKDEKMKKLEDQLSDYDSAIAETKNMVKGNDNKALQRLQKSRDAVEEKIAARRDELQKKFADTNDAVKVKEAQGKMASAEKHKASHEKQLGELKEQAEALEKQLMVFGRGTADLENRKVKVRTLQQMTEEMNRDLHKIWLEKQAPQRVQRIEEAIAPSGTSVKRKIALVAFSGVASFILVGLAVSFFEFQARRISSSAQLVDGLGLRVVGALPSISRPGKKALAAANGDLNRLLVESIDTIRTNLIHCATSEPMRVVMVTSALDREGKTTVASQLAASLARCGRRTLLIDGDLRRPTAHRLFELPLEPGLCEVLRGEAEIDDVIRPTRVAGLWMISAGQYDLESIQALSKDGIGEAFDLLRSRFDFIVVDSAPVLSIADASTMGQHVDAAILSVMREVSQAAKVYEASEQLRSVGVHVLGAVINGERTSATYRAYAAHT